MYRTIDDFLRAWKYESESTQKMLAILTDASLSQPVAGQHRTLGRVAWHIAATIPEMMGQTGLKIAGPDPHSLAPRDVATIRSAYKQAADSLATQVRDQWDNKALELEDSMYGEKWARGVTLNALLLHQAHHRGQMTVLMRQAGLKVPGVYGPALEEWAQMGAQPPAV